MKNYTDLIPISAKVNKKQNRMTILCIILSVFLVTGVFSMADMGVRMEEANAKQKHGSWHIMLKDITEETAYEIAKRKDMAAFSRYDVINYNIKEDYYINGKKAAVAGVDKTFVTDIFNYLAEGNFPRNEKEALISLNVKENMGINIGDKVVLNTPYGNFEYTISGFIRDDGSASMYDAVVLCVDTKGFEKLRSARGKPTEPVYYYRFNKYINVRKAINDIKEQWKLTDNNLSENLVMVGLSGFSENSILQGMYGVAAALFVLILTAGVLMIAGSMNSNIARRTKFFGMLRCIGASKKQIINIVRFEALYWCKTAVPIGVALGMVITWLLCAVLKLGIGGEFSDMPLFGISIIGIVCGVLVGIVTVLVAAGAPAKRAAKTSPIEAVSQNINMGNSCNHRLFHKFNCGFFKTETLLGIRHATDSKKNLLLMTGSFAFSIILFLGFSAIHDWTRYALNGLQPHTPDLSFSSEQLLCNITDETMENVGSMHGVKNIFGRSFKGNFPITPYKDIEGIDLVSLDTQQFRWAEEEKWTEDVIGLEQVYNNDNCVMTVYDKDNPFVKGDRLGINGEVLEIACVLTDSPIGGSGRPTILCGENTFRHLTGELGYSIADIQLTKDAKESDVQAIRREIEAKGFSLSDRRETNREIVSTYWAFTLLVYGFLTLIALISVFNIINSISMSVSARMKQYGIMRSIGMTTGQLTKIICAETMIYTLCGLACGMLLGLFVHKKFYESFVTNYFGRAWDFPTGSVIVVVLFVIVAWAAAVYMPSERIKNMPVASIISNE